MKDMTKPPNSDRRRVPGGRWRILCPPKPGFSGPALTASSLEYVDRRFDEVAVDDWLHVEQLNKTEWHVRIGDRIFNVSVSENSDVPSRVTQTGGPTR